ncbi:hypothetical protein HMF8227_00470 [Saliniradius amylolyticus]|uniref:Metallo-beta-lactamase domain-containing protein n=2 Tax=Saliniradius amylolyticus TaxID=2183582 RepID=A0A2S2E016_9ALTE|nr:hypothetical protein HMF8227_00470 [Saliniradius amylolyticus]
MRWLTVLLAFMLPAVGATENPYDDVEIQRKHLSGSVHMLTGAGGNIGVSAGEDGVLIIDDQFAPLAEKIAASVAEIGNSEVRYIVNTHYHGDHTGSNAWFAEHHHATVFAHHNVRVRLSDKAETQPASLPVVTYDEGVKFHFNGDTIHVMHLPSGHTDGDSVIWFENANVLHPGDLFFEGRFPYIDLNGGGNVAGYIANVETLIDRVDADTQIIPGHGKLANKADYQRFLNMIKTTYAYVQSLKKQGLSLEQAIETGLQEQWQPWSWRFIDEKKWIETLYQG